MDIIITQRLHSFLITSIYDKGKKEVSTKYGHVDGIKELKIYGIKGNFKRIIT